MMIIIQHLIIWIVIFLIIASQANNIKEALKGTGLFLVLLYMFFGYLYLIVYLGGHL